MGARMIVKDMAARLASCTGQEEAHLARQIRYWAQHGLFMFEIPQRSGAETNSRFYFNDRHLAAAYVYACLAGQGWTVHQLKVLAAAIGNAWQGLPSEFAALGIDVDPQGNILQVRLGKSYGYGFAGLPSIHLRIELPPEILLLSGDPNAVPRISWPDPVDGQRAGR